MTRTILRISLLFAFVLAVAYAAPCYAFRNDFNQTYALQPGGSFDLQNVNGDVEVQGWDRDEVEIHAVKIAREKPSDLERVSIDVKAKPNSVSVATHYPQNEGVEVAVEYTVHLPHTARVEHIGTVNGTLRISGMDTLLDLHSVNGNIEVYEAGGTVHARTTNGNLHIELAGLHDPGGASAETTNGSVLLAVPIGAQANLEALCMNGDFRSELPLTQQSSLRPREVRARLGRGGPPIRLRTINGSIRVVGLRSSV
jgi:DUF4097 and DUF4098 domain-containing protein YvlB